MYFFFSLSTTTNDFLLTKIAFHGMYLTRENITILNIMVTEVDSCFGEVELMKGGKWNLRSAYVAKDFGDNFSVDGKLTEGVLD